MNFRFLIALFLFGLSALPLVAQEAPPTPLPDAAEPGAMPQATLPATTAEASAPAEKKIISDTYKSVLFTPAQMQRLKGYMAQKQQMIMANRKMTEETNIEAIPELALDVVTGESDSKPTSYTYPQFFLDSIAYHTAEDWTVWVNGIKITPVKRDTIPGLALTNLSPYQAEFMYVPRANDRIKLTTEKTEDERVTVDAINRRISFLLQPNQTFGTFALKVYEGKVAPKTIPLMGDEEIISNTVQDTVQDIFSSEDGAPAAPPPERTGLGGLIEGYRSLENTQ